MAVVAEECAAAERLDDDLVDHWLDQPQRRGRARGAHQQGLRGRHHGGQRPLGGPAHHLRAGRGRDPRRRGHPRRLGPPVPQLHRRRLPLLHLRGPGRAPTTGSAYYQAAWDAGTRAVLAAGGSLSHHHGVGLNRARFVREALGPAFEVLAAIKDALDPQRDPEPRQAGPALPVRRPRLAVTAAAPPHPGPLPRRSGAASTAWSSWPPPPSWARSRPTTTGGCPAAWPWPSWPCSCSASASRAWVVRRVEPRSPASPPAPPPGSPAGPSSRRSASSPR